MVSTLDSITEEIAAECDRDTVGLWEVCAAVERSGAEEAIRGERVLAVCAQLLEHPEIRCCQFERDVDAFVVWSGSSESILERIRAGYDSLAGRVSLGDVVWFSTERYLNDLLNPAVKWPDARQTI
jgi:hypothetical protein